MIILFIALAIYLILWAVLVIFTKNVMIQGNPNPTYSTTWSLRNLGHKALYALAGVCEFGALAGIVYGVGYDIVWLVQNNALNAIWIGLLGIGITFACIKFHTWLMGVIDKLFG